jgi:hypothetical protein
VPPVFDQARVHTLFTDTGGDGHAPILITGIVAVIGTGVRNTISPLDRSSPLLVLTDLACPVSAL